MQKKEVQEIKPNDAGFRADFKKLGFVKFLKFIFRGNYKIEDEEDLEFKVSGLKFLLKESPPKKRDLDTVIFHYVPHDPYIAGFALLSCAKIEKNYKKDSTVFLWQQIFEVRREENRKKDRLDFQELVIKQANFLFLEMKDDPQSFVSGLDFEDFLFRKAHLLEKDEEKDEKQEIKMIIERKMPTITPDFSDKKKYGKKGVVKRLPRRTQMRKFYSRQKIGFN